MYWYAWQDLPSDVPVQDGLWFDPRHYHLGAVMADGRPKLLARMLRGGTEAVRDLAALPAPARNGRARPLVITDGAGFIRSNLAESYLSDGRDVVVFDNLSRDGVEENLAWLRARHRDRVHPAPMDLSDAEGLAA